MSARAAVAAMAPYTLELHTADVKLNQNESPYDFPFKNEVFTRIAERGWNRYPDFESTDLRTALAEAYGLAPENVLVGNGSNELLAAAVGAFVGPGTPVVVARPSFALYEKLVTIAGGIAIPIDIDPSTGVLPLEGMLLALENLSNAVVLAGSPNNPTGGVLPRDGIIRLLATGATVLFDRAYGDFASAGQCGAELPPLHERLITFSTFSKAWGLAALRVGWLATDAVTCREIRKVKLPYSLNIVSETAAMVALANWQIRDANVGRILAERDRLFTSMRAISRVTVHPSSANFIAFRSRALFSDFLARGILVRRYDDFLRVSIGTPVENDRFLDALKELA